LAEAATAAVTGAMKASDRQPLLPVVRRQREAELAEIARVAADKATSERLAVIYKIDT